MLFSGGHGEHDHAAGRINNTAIGEDQRLSVGRPIEMADKTGGTSDFRDFALRPAKSGNDQCRPAIVITAEEGDLIAIGRPGGETLETTSGMSKSKRPVAAHPLHVQVAVSRVLAVPEERDLPGVR